jgi:hypothetical protein
MMGVNHLPQAKGFFNLSTDQTLAIYRQDCFQIPRIGIKKKQGDFCAPIVTGHSIRLPPAFRRMVGFHRHNQCLKGIGYGIPQGLTHLSFLYLNGKVKTKVYYQRPTEFF